MVGAVTRRWHAWRDRRRAARAAVWVGLDDLTASEAKRVHAMRKHGRTPTFAADRIHAGRARRRLSSRPGGFTLEALYGKAGRR